MISWHRFVSFYLVDDFLRMGWVPRGSLNNTYHGQFAVHMEWRCCCGRTPR